MNSQVSPPDSAATYVRLALAAVEDFSPNGPPNQLRFARRAFALYVAQNDTFGMARALNLIAGPLYAAEENDSVLVISRRVLNLLSGPRTDSAALAEANALYSLVLMRTMAPLDSAAVYRARSLELHRRLPDKREEGRQLGAHGEAFSLRAVAQDFQRADPALLDSALRYYHAALVHLRATADTPSISGVLGLVANVWQRRQRMDSVLFYRQSGFALSNAQNDLQQMLFDLSSITQAFRTDVEGPNTVSVRNLDSALHWSRHYFETAARLSKARQASAAGTLAGTHTLVGNPDSARFYIQWMANAGVETKNISIQQNALTNLAGWYRDRGYDDSTVAVRRASELASHALTGRNAANTRAVAGLLLATAHLKAGALDSADVWYKKGLAAAETDTAIRHMRFEILLDMAEAARIRKRPDSALTLYAKLERELSGNATNERRTSRAIWQGAARALYDLGMMDSASTLVELIVSDKNNVSAQAFPIELLESLQMLSSIQRFLGRADSALALDRSVLKMAMDEGRAGTEIDVHRALGRDFEEGGLSDSAYTHYRIAIRLAEQRQFVPRVVSSLTALASWYLNTDAPDSALAVLRRAGTGAAALRAPDMVREPLAIAYAAIGRFDSALVNMEGIAERRGAESVTSLEALGTIRLRMGQPDTAGVLLRRALTGYRSSNARRAIPGVLAQLSSVETQLGRPDSAMAMGRDALRLARASTDRLVEGRALVSIGRAQFALRQTDSARATYRAALTVFTNAGFARDARETLAELAELFRTRRQTGDLALATAYFDSAAATVDNARRRTGDDENAVAFVEQQTDVYGGWARAWVGRQGEVGASRSTLAALGAVERGRAQSLLELLQRDPAASQTRVHRAGGDLAAEADSLLAGIRAAHGAALSYLHAGDTLFAWFVAPDGRVELLPPAAITEKELGALVRSARRSFEADDARSIELNPDELRIENDSVSAKGIPADDLKRLAELLLPLDLDKRVSPGTPIVIVPHGAIALVPFAALEPGGRRDSTRVASEATAKPIATTRPGERAQLGLRNPLRYAPSFAALNASSQATRVAINESAAERAGPAVTQNRATSRSTPSVRPNKAALAQALVVGNPTMPYVYSGRANNRAQLRPLPGAEAESRTIARLLGARVFTGKAATETMVRNRMANAPLIHFATHGLGYGTHTSARRSYVAFAPDSLQDGLLTLGELMDDRMLTLKADLVVLSACQTGLGDLKKAEGSIGLQRAFLAKGARSVLVSLWNVDDRATRLLMEKFYGYWLDPIKPHSKAEALQLAQSDVRNTKGFADPKYWAAFQLVGGN